MTKELPIHPLAVMINAHSVPVWFLNSKADHTRTKLSDRIEGNLGAEFFRAVQTSCRGVEAQRLPVILSTGCDLEPSDAPFFAGPLDKALEYGCLSDQIIQVFHPEFLKPSWRECPASISAAERREVEAFYPTVIPSTDGSHLWFTRFPAEDKRAATDYERQYGFLIPGDASKALAALIFISEDLANLAEFIESISAPS